MGSRSAEITLLFGTEDRVFRLTPVRWEKVQEACDAGPPEIMRRLSIAAVAPKGMGFLDRAALGGLGQWRVQDVRSPLLQGLIGGGMKAEAAETLCRELFDDRPLMDNVPTALQVVMASLVGPGDEPVGEKKGSRRKAASSPGGRSASRTSTATPRS